MEFQLVVKLTSWLPIYKKQSEQTGRVNKTGSNAMQARGRHEMQRLPAVGALTYVRTRISQAAS